MINLQNNTKIKLNRGMLSINKRKSCDEVI